MVDEPGRRRPATRAVGDQASRIAAVSASGSAAAAARRRAGLDGQADGAALQQPGHDGLGVAGIGQGPARRRRVEGEAEAVVAGGGDGGRDAELGGDRRGPARWRRDGRRAAARPPSRPRPPRPPAARRSCRRDAVATARIRMPLAHRPTIVRPAANSAPMWRSRLGKADVGRAVGAGGGVDLGAGQAATAGARRGWRCAGPG